MESHISQRKEIVLSPLVLLLVHQQKMEIHSFANWNEKKRGRRRRRRLSFCLLVVVECCGILSLCFFYFVHSVVNLLFYLAYTPRRMIIYRLIHYTFYLVYYYSRLFVHLFFSFKKQTTNFFENTTNNITPITLLLFITPTTRTPSSNTQY